MSLPTGHILKERYRIVEILGQGGMGLVYRAWDINLKRSVALKEMRPQPDLSPQLLQQLRRQFEQEAQVLAHLSHPCLVNVTDYFSIENNDYLVMLFIQGESLDKRIQQEGALSEQQVLSWAIDLLDALIYCHQKGVLHRDIKPQNIIITPDNKPVLVDFGLVKLWDPNDPRTHTAMAGMGTPAYAPPEQFLGSQQHTDPRTDLYSLGATLYHALAGYPPASASERMALPEQFLPLEKINGAVTPRVAAAIAQAMSLVRDQRFSSAESMKIAFLPPTISQRRMPVWAWVGLILICLAGGITGFLMARPETEAATLTATLPSVAFIVHTVMPSSTFTPTALPPSVTPTPTHLSTATPTNTPEPTVTQSPTSSPTPQPVLAYWPVSLGSQANAPLGFPNPPSNELRYGDIPFQVGTLIFKSQADAEADQSYPTQWSTSVNITEPQVLYLLINSGNGFTHFYGRIIGTVTVTCNSQNYQLADLILGQNIREWHEGDNVIAAATQTSQIWRQSITSTVDGFIDLLGLTLPLACQQSLLTAITVSDVSQSTLGTLDPALNLVGVTVSYFIYLP